MSDDSDHFFSALNILSDVAAAASAEQADSLAPIYADESILICSLPESPCSDSSDRKDGGEAIERFMEDAICDDITANDSRPQPAEKEIGAEISSHDSDEKRQENTVGKESIENDNINPNFYPDISGGFGDLKDGDGSRATKFPVKEPQIDLASIIKMLSIETDPKLGDIDILEIAAMRGIHFGHPKWWRPGGYGPKKDQDPENP